MTSWASGGPRSSVLHGVAGLLVLLLLACPATTGHAGTLPGGAPSGRGTGPAGPVGDRASPLPGAALPAPFGPTAATPLLREMSIPAPTAAANATGNLSAAIGRAVLLVGLAAGGVVTLVWARVALSWFSHDPSRKVQAKERARDALVGSLVLLAAVSGLAWGLARWVLTGS